MKKIAITLIMALAAIAANVNAQTMVDDGEADTVSVGSQMPYTVVPDADIQSLVTAGVLDPSQFDWSVVSGTGAVINTAQTGLGYYPDSILITWGGSPENAQISVAENSIKKDGSVLCTGSTETLNVVIVDLPKLDATVDVADCGITDTISVDLTGIGPWTIKYEYDHTPLGGSATTYDNSGNYYEVTVGSEGSTDGTYSLPLDFSDASNANGVYSVTINEVDDRISLKALNDIGGSVSASIQIVAAPTPNTGAIRHIEN